jgi:hypothetical protein
MVVALMRWSFGILAQRILVRLPQQVVLRQVLTSSGDGVARMAARLRLDQVLVVLGGPKTYLYFLLPLVLLVLMLMMINRSAKSFSQKRNVRFFATLVVSRNDVHVKEGLLHS